MNGPFLGKGCAARGKFSRTNSVGAEATEEPYPTTSRPVLGRGLYPDGVNYLDYAATTPVIPEASEALLAYLSEDFGNPSSVHAWGRKAREAVEVARERVAAAIGASPAEIVFT